jgi:hypothetical protein
MISSNFENSPAHYFVSTLCICMTGKEAQNSPLFAISVRYQYQCIIYLFAMVASDETYFQETVFCYSPVTENA